ncbi:MAG: ankyrin repeat domain-containing protein [Lutibacter sp.]|uniref:ankyrin repeat domain-containing protein n=1 Tax=Lutibacter sp. TaxID=1925666 RepID=UPI00385883DA
MKIRISLLIFIFCISIVPANTNIVNTPTSIIPIKEVKPDSKEKSNNNYFLYSNKLYKVNSFCKLIQAGNYNAVKSCIDKGIGLNKASNKLTPLMYAARHNRVNILQLLIEKGADLKAKSSNGFTALNWAKKVNAKETYEILLKAKKV